MVVGSAGQGTRLLTKSQVAQLIDMPAVMEAVEAALVAHARGETQMPPKVYLEFTNHMGDLRAMPALVGERAGVKWINSHPNNPLRFHLPTVRGVYLLSDPANGDLLAMMDATLITALRTGASAGLATRVLARGDARTVGIIGCGAQAPYLLSAVLAARAPTRILVADRDEEKAQVFATSVGAQAVSLEAAAACDIVCTATPSREPLVRREWLQPGAHINAMGADAHGKQELQTEILREALVIVDDLVQAQGSGEVNVPLAREELALSDLAGTLGAVLAGDAAGRLNEEDLTVFDSTGLAIQDVAVAALAYERAVAQGVGTELDFFA
ncbi:MAG: NAD(P)-binding domain-containing protein [Pseudomonadota bacterium]